MNLRRGVALLAAVASVALLWSPYFSVAVDGSVRLVSGDVQFVSAWLARAGVALLVVAAVVVFRSERWAAATATVSLIVTLLAGAVPSWRGVPAGWAYYTSLSNDYEMVLSPRTPLWGWGLALLVAVGAATAPFWTRTFRQEPSRAATICVAVLALATLLVASFGPVFAGLRIWSRGYIDYLPEASGGLTGWHGWFVPAGLVFLVLAAAGFAARTVLAALFGPAAIAAIIAAGVDRPLYERLGWAYWVTLAGAIAVTAAALAPRSVRQWSVSRSVVSYN